jgi:hypothetical protein
MLGFDGFPGIHGKISQTITNGYFNLTLAKAHDQLRA